MNSLKCLPFILIFFLLPFVNFAQDQKTETTVTKAEKWSFKLDFDSRRTFVQRNSVRIFGVRVGLHKNKFGFGVGYYSSRTFGILDKSISKTYSDNKLNPPQNFPAEFDFDYFSIFGDYILLKKNKWQVTANTQLGLGRVDIDLLDVNSKNIKERKSLVEHSVKVNYQALRWLRFDAGIGYRYLIAGEQQIKNAFNAPIYIVGLNVNTKELFRKRKKG